MDPYVELKEIDKENIEEVLALEVSAQQRDFVQTPAVSLAKAWAYKQTAFPFAVYAQDMLVGYIMLGYYEQKGQYTVWQFLIDARYQHKGYGRAALALGIQFLRDRFHAAEVYLGVKFQNSIAKNCTLPPALSKPGKRPTRRLR